MGKDRFEAEQILGGAGLKFRVRATRPSSQLEGGHGFVPGAARGRSC